MKTKDYPFNISIMTALSTVQRTFLFLACLFLALLSTSCQCNRDRVYTVNGSFIESCSDDTGVEGIEVVYYYYNGNTTRAMSNQNGGFTFDYTEEYTGFLSTGPKTSIWATRHDDGVLVDSFPIAYDVDGTVDLGPMAWDHEIWARFEFGEHTTDYLGTDSLFALIDVGSSQFVTPVFGPIRAGTVLDSVRIRVPPHTGTGVGITIVNKRGGEYFDYLFQGWLNTGRGNVRCLDFVQPIEFQDFYY